MICVQNQKNQKPHTLISLVDGFVFDVERGNYCLADETLREYQVSTVSVYDNYIYWHLVVMQFTI